jgi:protein-ribulosamine 3-kinase
MIVKNELTELLEAHLSTKILSVAPVSGGSINAVYCLQTQGGKYLLKVNDSSRLPNMFRREAEGLQAIAAVKAITVPQIILQDEAGDTSFLLLEWIESRRPTVKASVLLGRQLAGMHRSTAVSFGFDTDNYMGSLTQSNKAHTAWSEFFIQERLMPMVKLAADKQLLIKVDIAGFERLYKKLPELFYEEAPSLIHGDLWGGNYLTDENGKPYLIDPAVSYGHREFDIAMTTLFGGFAREFYTAYHEAFALDKGWHERIDLWNLYPLLVHLNLFGASYLGQVRDCLGEYV